MTTYSLPPQEQRTWRNCFIILSALIIIIMPALSHAYGQSGDEWIQMEYAQDIWNYFVHGDRQVLDYTNKNLQHSKLELYGGLFDFPMNVLHHWMPSVSILAIRHFFNALSGAIMMVFTGLLGMRLSRKWSVGLLTLLFMFFSPRMFGESMNNPKDIPFSCGFVVGIYFLLALLQDFPRLLWRHAAGLMLGWGFAFGVRAAGGILLIAYFVLFIVLYYLLYSDFRERLKADKRLRRKGMLALGVAIVGGYIIGLSCWPWGLQSPLSHPLESLSGMTNREAYLKVLFDGRYYMSTALPWYYELKWIIVSSPLVVIAGCVIFLLLIFKSRRTYGLFPAFLILFSALFPLVYAIYKHSTVYDTWRHMFFVYPYWAIAGAFGWHQLTQFIKKPKWLLAPYAVALAGLLPAIIWTIRSHPNQYVYFNEIVGGVKGAAGKWETDYYQNSGMQAAQWLKKNMKPIPGRKVFLRSNMGGFNNYFARDTSWVTFAYGRYNERHEQEWDYYVAYSRFIPTEEFTNGTWPPKNAIHTISIDGVPLSAILPRKSNEGMAAKKAYDAKDFATAATLYQSYLAADPDDEYALVNYGIALASTNRLPEAATALKHATDLDPGNAQVWDILSQVYGGMGNAAGAQEAHNRASAIAEEEAEYAPKETE